MTDPREAPMQALPEASPARPDVISRDEWQRRYAARIMECAGWPEHAAIEAGRVGAEEYERSERAAGNAVLWLGTSAGGPWDTPEALADEEMSYWENDE